MKDFATSPAWGSTQISPYDQARLFCRIDSLRAAPAPRRTRGRCWPGSSTGQRWGIPPALPNGWRIYFKGGWLPPRLVNQVGLLERGDARGSRSRCFTRRRPVVPGTGRRRSRAWRARLLLRLNELRRQLSSHVARARRGGARGRRAPSPGCRRPPSSTTSPTGSSTSRRRPSRSRRPGSPSCAPTCRRTAQRSTMASSRPIAPSTPPRTGSRRGVAVGRVEAHEHLGGLGGGVERVDSAPGRARRRCWRSARCAAPRARARLRRGRRSVSGPPASIRPYSDEPALERLAGPGSPRVSVLQVERVDEPLDQLQVARGGLAVSPVRSGGTAAGCLFMQPA